VFVTVQQPTKGNMVSKRNIETVQSDIDKLQNLMETLGTIAREGYTIRQRIEHHEKMASLLKEKLELQGGSLDR